MVIHPEFVSRIVEHSKSEYPNEACGLLGTSDGEVTAVYPVKNAEASPVHYRLDSIEQLKATEDIEEHGWEVGAVYHSHTHTGAFPSDTDVRLAEAGAAFYPEVLYLIVSLARDEPELRAFKIESGGIQEEVVEIR